MDSSISAGVSYVVDGLQGDHAANFTIGDTDPKAVLSISMGAVAGIRITEKHRVCIDQIRLEKIDADMVSAE